MLPSGKLLLDSVTGSGSATNGGTVTSANIDTLGVQYVEVDIAATTQAASTQAGSPSLIKLQECDTTVSSSFVDITGTRLGSAAATNVDALVGIGVTQGPNQYKFRVNCSAGMRKRYLRSVVNPTTTQTFNTSANGFRVEQGPITAAKAGDTALLNLVEL